MNKNQAIKLMQLGAKVTHPSFTKDEWATITDFNTILTEDGVKCSSKEWWSYRQYPAFDKDWSLWEEDVIIEIEGKSYIKVKINTPTGLDKFNEITKLFLGRPLLNRTTFSDKMLEEYKLILQKKSKLSSSKRQYISHLFNKHFKQI